MSSLLHFFLNERQVEKHFSPLFGIECKNRVGSREEYQGRKFMDAHDDFVHEVLRQQYGYTLTVGA
jgi:hypothetical protein